MGAPPKSDDPVVTPDDLLNYDGIMFGLSGRFGSFPAQFKNFWDSTGGLWAGGKLYGKPAGLFVSTGSQGGGQETVALSCVSQVPLSVWRVFSECGLQPLFFCLLCYRDSS